jgi:signal transduction histidine kinase/ligand-binding sensor domain-containing protein
LLVVLLILTGSAQVAYSQDFDPIRFEKIETGFITNTFIQDRDGFFWIGGNNGLYKYDGYTFKPYVAGPGSIAGNYVTALYEDSRGVIWAGSLSGLSVYDKATDTFTNWLHDPDDPASINSDHIGDSKQQAIVEDADSMVWIGTGNGLNRFDSTTRTFTHYQEQFIDPDIWSIYLDAEQFLWVGTSHGLHKFDPRRGRVLEQYETNNDDFASLHGKHLSSILEDRDGTLWVGTMNGGINRLEKGQKRFTHYRHDPDDDNSLSADGVLSIMEDVNGMLWFATVGGGLNLFDKGSGTFTHYLYNPDDVHGIAENYITKVYQDPLGVIWFSGLGGILHRNDPGSRKFKRYVHNPQNPDSLSKGPYIAQVIEDQEGIIWIAVGSGGLNRYDRRTRTFTHYRHDPSDPVSLPESHGQSVIEDNEGNLWVTTRNDIVLFDKQAGKVLQTYPGENWPSSPVQDSTNPEIIWYGTWGSGLLKFNRSNGEISWFVSSAEDPGEIISDNTISNMYQDDTGMIWLCTRGGGLDKFDPRTEKVVAKYKYSPTDSASISSNSVYHVFQDSVGRYWVSTDKGVDQFDPDTGKFQQYNQRNGLFPLRSASQILEDRQGYLWISGYYSGELVKFDAGAGVYKSYSTDDGLLSGIGGSFTPIQTQDGALWFYGRGGINMFHPEQIKDNSYQPPVFLTSLTQGGEPTGTGEALERVDTLQLDWRHNFFEFKAAALNYRHPEHNRYRYKLEGVDHGWFDSGNLRQGRYTGLAPGEYTLKIQGSNNDSLWSDKIVELKVIVTPPWWETWGFRGAMVILVTGLIYGGGRHRVKIIEDQKHRLEIMVEEKTRDLDERVKELGCLYGISKLVEKEHNLEEILHGTVLLIPPAWWYPEVTCAQIRVAGQVYRSYNFKETQWRQSQKITVFGRAVGTIEIYYLEEKPEIDEGPFCKEERNLINAIAERLGYIIGLKQAEEEREMLEVQLRHSQKMEAIGTMAGGISHNFNNILAAIIGYAEMVKKEMPENIKAYKYIGRVLGAAHRATDLVRQIMAFSKQKDSPKAPYPPDDLLHEVLDSIRNSIHKNIKVDEIISTDIGNINLAQSLFRTVVGNLCMNALDAMGEGHGILGVTLENIELKGEDLRGELEINPGEFVKLTITDTGHGIAAENMTRIFNPFFTTKEVGQGEGIGLSVVHGIVKKRGGRIIVESEPGKGAAFHVFLPVAEPVLSG